MIVDIDYWPDVPPFFDYPPIGSMREGARDLTPKQTGKFATEEEAEDFVNSSQDRA